MSEPCNAIGPYHGDRCDGGRVQSPNALDKLTPAPWVLASDSGEWWNRLYTARAAPNNEIGSLKYRDDLAFVAMARNAFDVMMRRGWWPVTMTVPWNPPFLWMVTGRERLPWQDDDGWLMMPEMKWPDPFTALVEADKWYAANVGK